ncbi:unnamed protein product [Acanthoscelides obtectus]|uniref:Uncharacterized protein n=1 Tax=Acanthoscelides obtectus TaxID=200917 RepID=A0A9P0KR00_ACAOB|nr:unnamed protein product [Acanthoscelides obtectus]CAK1660041.1 hypothetical protein AOBTE_LOCUS21840 [Acanthoscelides obtectus]
MKFQEWELLANWTFFLNLLWWHSVVSVVNTVQVQMQKKEIDLMMAQRCISGSSGGRSPVQSPCAVRKRPTLDRMFASTSQRNDDGLRASYNISLLIAKSGKPHTIGEKLILPAVEEVLKTVLHKPASDIIK